MGRASAPWLLDSGDESKEQAQLQLIDHLAHLAGINQGFEILDIGCGFGATSLFLAKNFNASVTGINTSPVQIQLATESASKAHLDVNFLLMDAESMNFQKQFDLLWSVESISHYQHHEHFFASAAKLLKPGGVFAITDWFKKENLTPEETAKFIDPIDEGMMVKLRVMDDYAQLLSANNLQVTHREILNDRCAKTWDLSLDIIKDKSFWVLATKLGPQFISYLKSFQVVRTGFATGNFVYGLLIARAPSAMATVHCDIVALLVVAFFFADRGTHAHFAARS